MSRWPVLAELGPDVEVETASRGVLAVRRGAGDALRAQGFRAEGGDPARTSDLSGRSALGELSLDGARLVVRRFAHGGLFRWAMGRRFADPERPFRELALSDRLRGLGIQTPEVIAARAVLAPLGRVVGGWTLDLVTRRVEGALDVAHWLEALREERVSSSARRVVARELGRFVGRFHAAGLWHADLNPRNLLLVGDAAGEDGEPPSVQTIDLDRSRIVEGGVGAEHRRANLARLLRAVLRREGRGAPFLRRTDLARFLSGYRAGLGADGGRDRRKSEWRAVADAYAASVAVHRLGWRLERALGGGPEKRDGGADVRRPRA